MEYSFIIAVIPVILVVAFLVWIAKKITDGERLDMKEGVLGVVILMVAVLIMVPMVSSTQTYTWDEDAGELTIKKNVFGGYYAWDEYANDVRSLVIDDGVTIGSGAFDSLTSLEYVSIGEGVTVGSGDFGVSFKDYTDATVNPQEGVYAGYGDGTLYGVDETIFTYSNGNVGLTTSAVTDAKNVVIPESLNGAAVTGIRQSGFQESNVVNVIVLGDSMTTFAYRSFREAASLERITVPDSLTSIAGECFYNCTSLESVSLPRISTLGNSIFYGCTALKSATFEKMPGEILTNLFSGCSALESFDMPEGVLTVGASDFYNCTSLESVSLPDSLTTLGTSVFAGCTDIASVKIGAGLTSVSSNTFSSWTFYASDGTTTIDKTVASNLAGKTFQGTASALVEVEPGQLTLTPQQIQQVHLHDTELQDLKDQISIEPLPLQPSLQEQDLTA